jgi:hypothetical protein
MSERVRMPVVASIQAKPDPIFALIERYETAAVACDGCGADEPSFDAYVSASRAFLDTVPTTLAGMKAKIAMLEDDQALSECLTSTMTNEPLLAFLNTLYESARILAVQS